MQLFSPTLAALLVLFGTSAQASNADVQRRVRQSLEHALLRLDSLQTGMSRKGEFETTEEYHARLLRQQDEIDQLVLLDYEWTGDVEFGTYDADAQTLPIKIPETWARYLYLQLTVPPGDARHLKEQSAVRASGKFFIEPDGDVFPIGGLTLSVGATKYVAEPGRARLRVTKIRGLMSASSVSDMAFSLDGKSIATADPDEGIRIFETATQQLLQTLDHRATLVAWSPDGRLIATGGVPYDGPGSGQMAESRARQDSLAQAVARDSALLPQLIARWSGKQLRPEVRQPVQRDSAAIAYRLEANRSALTEAQARQAVRLWDAGTGQEVISIPLRNLLAVRFLSGEKLITSDGSTVDVWDVQTREQVLQLDSPQAVALATSADGNLLATESWKFSARTGRGRGFVRVWSLPDGQLIHDVPATRRIRMALSRTGNRLATAVERQSVAEPTSTGIALWDVSSGQKIREFGGDVVWLSFSPDGRCIAAADRFMARRSATSSLFVYVVETGTSLGVLSGRGSVRGARVPHGIHFSRVAWSPDGRWLAASGGGAVVLYETRGCY